MFSRKSLAAVAVTILSLNTVALAQQPATPTAEGTTQSERMGRREGRRHDKLGRRGEIGLMRGLDLSESQKQQQRAIMQRRLESTKGPREELFKLREKRMADAFTAEDEARAKSLRQEIHTAMQGVQSEIEGILTAEQRNKLEQLRSERKARHEEMRERRRERKSDVPR